MNSFIIIVVGCIMVAVFDAIAAIISRKLKFNYAWFTFGSIAIYGSIAVIIFNQNNVYLGVLAGSILGVFDSIVGSKIAVKFNAYIKKSPQMDELVHYKMVIYMAVFGGVIGLLSISFLGN